jgi:NAD(P)-dependent dehydrogenase (short-subunit alcohol dehydrogenase family)
MSMRSDGPKVALVTGAGARVGAAVVERLQADGFAVGAVHSEAGTGGDLPIVADPADRDQMFHAAKKVADELGPVSVLFTSSAHHDAAPFGTMEPERWRRLLDAHLGGTVNACAAVVPAMVEAGGGTVVTTSSWTALAGVPGETYLAAATGTILAFTKSFAVEVARNGVRVNCIAVGPLDGAPPSPPVDPKDVAATVSFLAHDGDHFVGQVFNPSNGAVV